MPSIYQLKFRFQNLLRPLVRGLARTGITANHITILACALTIALGAYFLFCSPLPFYYLIVPGFLFVRMALNAIDGMLAREHGMASSLGALLNELTDVIADAVLYYPLAFLWGANIHLNVCFVILALLSEMTGVIGVQIGASRRYEGPLGKSDRAFVFGLLSTLYAFQVPFSKELNWIFIALIILELFTIFNRSQAALRVLKSEAKK